MKEKIKKILQITFNTLLWTFITFTVFCALLSIGLLIHNFLTQFDIINLEFILLGYLFVYNAAFCFLIFLLKQTIDSLFTKKFREKLLHAFIYFIALIIFIYLSLLFLFFNP